jgi:membrane-bound ClpP family serine protease
MKEYLFPVLLQVLGIFVIIVEIFVPSLGILTVIALGIFGYSLYLVFTDISVTAGYVFTGFDLILVPIVVYMGIQILARSNLSLKQELSSKLGVASQNEALESYLNMQGEAMTDLRPSGMARIGSERLDVVTDGEYIDKGTKIIVSRVTGNQIIVEKTK